MVLQPNPLVVMIEIDENREIFWLLPRPQPKFETKTYFQSRHISSESELDKFSFPIHFHFWWKTGQNEKSWKVVMTLTSNQFHKQNNSMQSKFLLLHAHAKIRIRLVQCAHLNGPLIKKNIRKTWKSDIWLFFTFSFSTAAERHRKKLKLHNDFCHSLCTINFNYSQLIAAAMNAKSCRATKVHEKFSPLKKRVCKTFQSINHRLNWLIVMFHKTTATWEDRLSMNYLVEW